MRPQQPGPAQSAQAVPPPGTIENGLVAPFELDLAATMGAPAAARAAVSAWMSGHVTDAMLVDVRLLVGELVTNSLLHADGPGEAVIRIHAEVCGDAVRFEVADRGTSRPIARRSPSPQQSGGFGLNVVDVVSRRWGVDRGAGTRVWAELAFQPTG
jgi:anti-sigma regulatory factor (Ser/Thr protein kinase)